MPLLRLAHNRNGQANGMYYNDIQMHIVFSVSLSRIFSVFVYFSSYFPNHFLVDLLSIKRQNICSILVKRNYTETYHSDAQTMKNDGLMLYCYIVFFLFYSS